MLWEKSRNLCNFFWRNNIIFHNSHLFLLTTYTLRVLIDVNVPLLINFLIFFAHPPPPLLILNPPVYYFFEFAQTKIRTPQKKAGFSGSFVDPYYEIDPFDLHFNITSELNCKSEEYVEKERTLAAIDDDDNDG